MKHQGIKCAVHSDGTVMIYGFVGDDCDELDAKTIISQIKALGDRDRLDVHINSGGGFVFEGLAIYNYLNTYDGEVVVHVDGLAASMASVIAMSGDQIIMPENALMMIHNPWDISIGDAEQLRKDADMLDKTKESLISIYVAKTGISVDEVSALMDAETWMSGTDALEQGFATEVTDSVDMAASLRGADVSTFKHVPESLTGLVAAAATRPKKKPSGSVPNANQPPQEVVMTEEERKAEEAKKQAAADKDKQAAVDKAKDEATKAERKRAADIRAAVKTAKLTDDYAQELIDSECSVEDAREKIINKWAEDGGPTEQQASFGLPGGMDERDKRVEAMSQATLARAGIEKQDTANPFRGMRMSEIARACANASGINTYGMLPEDYIKAALGGGPRGAQTTSDFPVILENTLHKMVLTGFMAYASTWGRFCKTGDATDFRQWNRLVPGLIGNLDTVNEAGEYLNKALPDAEKNPNQVVRRGNIIDVTIETLVNDDLGYIMDLANGVGMAGSRTIERAVYALLASNPTLADGVALFHATHGNLAGSGAAPSITTLEAADLAMGAQTAPGDDAEPLDISPDIGVVPRALRGTMFEINNAEFNDETSKNQRKPNRVRGLLSDIVASPHLTDAAAWYTFADPAMAPVIEVLFLNGQRDPRVTQEENFRTSGMAWKAELPFGVAAIDYRGAYKNPGV